MLNSLGQVQLSTALYEKRLQNPAWNSPVGLDRFECHVSGHIKNHNESYLSLTWKIYSCQLSRIAVKHSHKLMKIDGKSYVLIFIREQSKTLFPQELIVAVV